VDKRGVGNSYIKPTLKCRFFLVKKFFLGEKIWPGEEKTIETNSSVTNKYLAALSLKMNCLRKKKSFTLNIHLTKTNFIHAC